MFGSGRPGTFGSGIDGSCGFGSDVAGADGSFGRLTGSFGNWTGPTFGSWIPDPEPLEPLLPPPDRIFAAVPAAAPSGSWTAEPAVPLTVLPGEAEPEDDFGAEPPAEPSPSRQPTSCASSGIPKRNRKRRWIRHPGRRI